jgi:hypothetical protein
VALKHCFRGDVFNDWINEGLPFKGDEFNVYPLQYKSIAVLILFLIMVISNICLSPEAQLPVQDRKAEILAGTFKNG